MFRRVPPAEKHREAVEDLSQGRKRSALAKIYNPPLAGTFSAESNTKARLLSLTNCPAIVSVDC